MRALDSEERQALSVTRRALRQAERFRARLTEASAMWGDVDNWFKTELEDINSRLEAGVQDFQAALDELYPPRKRKGGAHGR
jgi:hypothetical protein